MAPLVLSNYNLTLEHLFRKSPLLAAIHRPFIRSNSQKRESPGYHQFPPNTEP